MQELIEVVKMIISSKMVPWTAFIILLPSLLNAIESFLATIAIFFILIRYRKGIVRFILKLFRSYDG